MRRTSVASTPYPPVADEVARRPLGRRVDPLSLASLPALEAPAVVTVRGWTIVVADPLAVVTEEADLDDLAVRCRWRSPRAPDDPPFVAGAVGFLTDDVSRGWLDLDATDERPAVARLPGLWFGLYDSAVAIPPGDGEPMAVAADLPAMSREPPAVRLDRWAARCAAAAGLPDLAASRSRASAAISTTSPADHRAAVHRILEWIAAGDLYQLNATFQVRAAWPAQAAGLAARLWQASPDAAHAAWLAPRGAGQGPEIASISPETFLRCDGDRVTIRPVKGTRPRGIGPSDDALGAELVASAKDAAEHVMIVDLERNDLGRVCRTGSVTVPELMVLEAHPTVWHLVSTVQGRLRAGAGFAELLRATFPCGSVTGAPKRMAVDRTRLVEPLRRGVYCGAIGVVTRGLVDLSVAIRTAVVSGGVASYGTGGGIVADSDPDTEWAEALDKAAAFLTATNTRLG